jgi:hypothetical protein
VLPDPGTYRLAAQPGRSGGPGAFFPWGQ